MSRRQGRSPLPLPLDLGVSLPLGALANLFDPHPDDAMNCLDRGRHEVDVALGKLTGRLDQAKATGQLAVTFGVPVLQRQFAAKVADARQPAGNSPAPSASRDTSAQEPGAASTVGDLDSDRSTVNVAPITAAPIPVSAPVSASADLAIPSYDTLSASQIVERIEGLNEHDRDAIARYEIAGRNRRTILGKIDQLQAMTA